MNRYYHNHKISPILYLSIIIFYLGNMRGQENPSVTGLLAFESTPVNLSTGMPNISIPLFKLPTYSEEVSFDFSLHYNPANVAYLDSLAGNCGRGWNLLNGGAIAREFKGVANGNVYQYSFLGYSGKFEVRNNFGVPQAVIIENKGVSLSIIINDKGLNYEFSSIEQFVYVKSHFEGFSSPDVRSPYRSVYRLTHIYDENELQLATLNYDTYEAVESYYIGNEKTIMKELKEIIIPGSGKAEFEKTFNSDLNTVNFTKLNIYNVLNEPVKRFDFIITNRKLTQVDIGDQAMTSKTSYKLYYKEIQPVLDDDTVGPDSWGFYTTYNKMCRWYPGDSWNPTEAQFLTNPNYVVRDVLQKMTLPTGGCIIYEFESNSYSYKGGIDMETTPDFFFTNNLLNRNNFTRVLFASHDFAVGNQDSFHLSSPGPGIPLYLRFDAERRLEPLTEYGSIYVYTNFIFLNGPTEVFRYLMSSHPTSDPLYANTEEACSGITFTVPTNGLTVKTGPQGYAGSISAYKMVLKSSAMKCHYGNGIRIKKIGFFESDNVPKNYYSAANSNYSPAKEISYDYNFFDNSIKSSGSTAETYLQTIMPKRAEPIWYKNVTVRETGLGKTTYNFYTPIDFPGTSATSKYKLGLAKEIKVYDDNDILLKSTNYSYENTDTATIGPRQLFTSTGLAITLGYSLPTEIIETSYYPDSKLISTTTAFTYNANRQVSSKTFSTANGDTYLSRFNYASFTYWMGSSSRKTEKELIENYKNSELISTTKVNYSNSWTMVDEGYGPALANERYLPVTTQTAKGAQSLLANQKFNLYNNHNRLLEVENKGGIKTVYLWGYKNSQIVAKIENADYLSIPKANIDAIRAASDSGNESTLLSALDALRNLPALVNAMITTFTYRPLIGIASVTDPKGTTQKYEYDESNRLKFVRDHKGKILSETEYHYRNEF
jgi:YD repeat-containing protein